MNLRLVVTAACLFGASTLPALSSDLQGCFATFYDKSHLQKYPGQTPTMLGVLIKHEDGNIIMQLTARLRGKKGIWGEAGGCTVTGPDLRCAIDCDGGGFNLTRQGNTVILTNKDGFRLTQTSCEGEAENITVEPVPGNRMFMLRKVEEKMCE